MAVASEGVEAPCSTPKACAVQAYSEGVTLFKSKNYKAALVAFQKADKLDSNSTLRWNIARVHEELGQWKAAKAGFSRWLNENPKAPSAEREDAERRRSLAASALALAARKAAREAATSQPASQPVVLPPPVEESYFYEHLPPWYAWAGVAACAGSLVLGAKFLGEEEDALAEAESRKAGHFADEGKAFTEHASSAKTLSTLYFSAAAVGCIGGMTGWVLDTPPTTAIQAGVLPVNEGAGAFFGVSF